MTFADIPLGSAIFLDANTLVYYFLPHPTFGLACSDLLERIEQGDLKGYVSSHVLAEMAHRLMTEEACTLFGWPVPGIAARLRRHPAEVRQLNLYRQAIDELSLFGIDVLSVTRRLVSLAADQSRQFGLLTNDAAIVAIMRDQGLTLLASNDADFDCVPWLTRYSPT